LAPFAAGLGSVLLVQAGDDLLGRGRGVIAAVLLNATLLFAVGATTMTPDTPLLLFWTMTLWALARLVATQDGRWWLVAGLAAGLALDSKYTAVLLAPAILLWLLATPVMRPWLWRPQPWLAAGIALVVFTPVLLWNADHGWISFAKQGGRAGDFDPGRAMQFLGELLAGQLGLGTPLVALLCGAGMVLAVRRAPGRDPAWTLLAAITAVPMLVFVQHALGDRVQANWPAVLYPGAAIAASGLWRRLHLPALALGFGLTALVWTQAAMAPIALPMMLDPTLLRLGGWSELARSIATEAAAQKADFVVADNYGQAALLARLLPAGMVVLGTEGRWQYFNLPDATPLITGHTGLLVRSARRDDHPDAADWATVAKLPPLTRARNGMTAETFRLYRVTGRPGADPIVVMPRPH
jgi:4-amino-4-deoxy-L-arabinose transferase-like glycosyltransferase